MLPKDIDEIEARAEMYKRYETISHLLLDYWAIWILVVLILYALFVLILHMTSPWYGVYLVPPVVAIILVLISRFAYKRMAKYNLEDEEWTAYYSNSIIENLEDYAGTKKENMDMRKDFRKNALKKAQEFHVYVTKRWKYSSFKMANDYFGDSVKDFRKNLQFRLIPNIKNGDDELLGKVSGILGHLQWGS